MKNLALIIAILLVTIGNITAKNSFDKAINSCKKVSTKDIQKSLCGTSTIDELLTTQYELVKSYVESGLKETLEDYQKFSKKNGKIIGKNKKKFQIKLDENIKKEVKKYLSLYRGALLEDNTKAIDSIYVASITELILKEYYVEKLLTAMTQYMSCWIGVQQKDYISFIKNSTLDPKIDQNEAMMKMSKTYLKDKTEGQKKVLLCLIDAYKISKRYNVNIKKVDFEQKYEFEYIKAIKTIANKIISGNFQKGMKLEDAIVMDIKAHIKSSTIIK